MNTYTNAPNSRLVEAPAAWRVRLFLAVAAVLALFEAFNATNLLAPWTDTGLAIADLEVPEAHLWHAALPGAARLLMTGGALIMLLRGARDKPLLVQWLAVSSAILLVGVVPFTLLALFFVVIAPAVAVVTYPWPSKVREFSGARPSGVLIALTAVGTVLLLPGVWQNFSRQIQDVGGEHATEAHWALDAAHVLTLLAAAALASTRRPGWRPLAYLTALTFVYLGVVALVVPDQPGSWGVAGGAVSLAGGLAFAAAALRESGVKGRSL